jgi:hypothetical protein
LRAAAIPQIGDTAGANRIQNGKRIWCKNRGILD